MTKLRKQRRRKTFQTNINRKRLRNKLNNKGKVLCDGINKEWEYKTSARKNLESMGLVYDPNKDLKKSNTKQELASKIASTSTWKTENNIKTYVSPPKIHVSEMLEKDANAPRERTFELPNNQVEWITYLMNKYGKDYKAMARDKKNYYQETWKQIRAKIRMFKKIPTQYNQYIKNKGLESVEKDNLSIGSSDSEL